jgi:hypothetical protein
MLIKGQPVEVGAGTRRADAGGVMWRVRLSVWSAPATDGAARIAGLLPGFHANIAQRWSITNWRYCAADHEP